MLRKIDAWFENLIKQKILLAILATTIILRIPSLFEPYWYGDEAIYLAIGEGINQGKLLYRDIFDHKPPAIYLLAALAGSLFWFKWILLVWHSATVILFWNFCKTIFSTEGFPAKNITRATILATIIFAILTTLPTFEGNIANAELFMVGPILGGFLLLWKHKPTFPILIWSGLLFSLAGLFKIPAFFEIAAILIYWLFISTTNLKEFLRSIFKSLVLGVIVLTPLLLLATFYLLQNAFSYFVQGVFSQNLIYIGGWSVPSLGNSDGGFSFGLTTRALVLAALLLIVFLARKLFDKITLFACIWLLVTTFAALLSGRPYPHYIIQVIAPVSIVASVLVFGKEKFRFLVVPAILLLLYSLNFYQFSHYQALPYYKNFISFALNQQSKEDYLKKFDTKTTSTYELANFLEQRTDTQDPVFIWGTMPELYALSRRLPPTRFIVAFHITGFNGQEETTRDLFQTPPKYIIRSLSENSSLPGLDILLTQRYAYETTVAEQELWRRIK